MKPPSSKLTAFLSALFVSAAVTAEADAARTQPGNDLSVYILLDRTGSMESIWDEALTSVNAYAEELAKDDVGPEVDASVSLAVFDAQDGLQFDMLRRNENPETWKPVTNDEASPRGMTPLFDAIGRIMTVAEADNPGRAVIVVMTDGEENSSTELTKENVKDRLDRARDKGWEIVFLGAEFANFADASSVGVSAEKSMAVSKDGMEETMRRLSTKSKSYGAAETGSAPITFDDEDRAAAGEEEVKQKQPN
jgi:hypothetical protein